MAATLTEFEDALSQLSLEQTELLESLVLRHKALLRYPISPESALLQEFASLSLPSSKLDRMRELRKRSEVLGDLERQEFLTLAGEEEEFAVRRVQIVGELAAIRGVPPRQVMAQLGILPGQ